MRNRIFRDKFINKGEFEGLGAKTIFLDSLLNLKGKGEEIE